MTDENVPVEPGPEALASLFLDKKEFLNDAKAPQIREEMGRYFDRDIELFPETDKSFLGIRRFYEFYSAQIESLFPIDRDAQASIMDLERKVRFQMIVNIGIKRVLLILALFAIFPWSSLHEEALRMLASVHIGPPSATYALILLVIAAKILLMWFSREIYDNQVSATASVENAAIAHRLSLLSSLFNDLLDEANKQKHGYKVASENPDRWSKLANWLIQGAIWTSMRVEYVERYFQTRMWRVRRTHRLVVFVSRTSALVMLAMYIWAVVVWSGYRWEPYVVDMVAATVIAFGSIVLFRAPPNEIKRRLNYGDWQTFKKLGMQEKLAGHVAFDKNEIWTKEINT